MLLEVGVRFVDAIALVSQETDGHVAPLAQDATHAMCMVAVVYAKVLVMAAYLALVFARL